jgi:hypothetical protein
MTDKTAPQLNLNDFMTVVNIIDVCTERGAFKGSELLTIGTLREKFSAFVKANTPQQSQEPQPEVAADQIETADAQ